MHRALIKSLLGIGAFSAMTLVPGCLSIATFLGISVLRICRMTRLRSMIFGRSSLFGRDMAAVRRMSCLLRTDWKK